MDNQWKEETCGTCDFRINGECLKNPPTLQQTKQCIVGEIGVHVNKATYEYPDVNEDSKACSCWREKQ